MTTTTVRQRTSPVIRLIFLSFVPALFLQAIDLLTGAPVLINSILIRWGFTLCVLLLSKGFRWGYSKYGRGFSAWAGIVSILIIAVCATSDNTTIAWLTIILLYALLIWLDSFLVSGHSQLKRLAIHAFLTFWAGFMPIALIQIRSNFAEEELYAGVITLILGLYWIVTAYVSQRMDQFLKTPPSRPIKHNNFPLILTTLSLISLAGVFVAVRAYQNSFFPETAPLYDGISTQSPYICGEVRPDTSTYVGQEIMDSLVTLVENNPKKASPEFAFLALRTKDSHWIEQFKKSILTEANAGLFTKPENSIKSTQYDAARRVFYYSQMINVWPNLFSSQENRTLRDWFVAINRRAQTVGWVDFLYALAFSKWPDGPYENQETGAGLLALLETNGLADPDLTDENQQYLAENPRGWNQRFRNTDDAYIYQSVWVSNALFQSQYFGTRPAENVLHSFEWLLLQALPDGAPLSYNHPSPLSPATSAYMGAELTGKDQFLWLAGRAAEYLLAHSGYLFANPGVTALIEKEGQSPDVGSCLLFGDSGLPNQVGPLAPDKIVFRNGWSPESIYLLLNLRFSGWHRYKATNTISMIYQDTPLIQDQTKGETPAWLPVGRSLFRDKRIPRENLNGLAIEITGLSKVIFALTQIGSIWAQDPPYFAEVKHFETGTTVDTSQTLIKDWHGWQHQRTVNFYHTGPIVIVDSAMGPKNQSAAVFWHLPESQSIAGNRITVRGGDHPVEMVLVPLDSQLSQSGISYKQENGDGLEVEYKSSQNGQVSLITVLLTENWIGADGSVTTSVNGPLLELRKNDQLLGIPLNSMIDISD